MRNGANLDGKDATYCATSLCHTGFFTIMNIKKGQLLRKSKFSMLTDLNPGFGGSWDMLVWPKEFLNFIHGFKSAILAIFQIWQNGTFEPVHEIQKLFWPKDFL